MTLRKGKCYSKSREVPYTRKSKVRTKGYIKAPPQTKIVKFTMGNYQKYRGGGFNYVVKVISREYVQIRDNALEACRLLVHRHLEKDLGKINYMLQVNAYPHHVLRENKMLTGAGADRMSTGMTQSFGKTIGIAAKVYPGSIIMTVATDNKDFVLKVLHMVKPKLPCTTSIVVEEKKN
ncbi:50S ribosomal protein L16 [Candidatus Pacearchaeota archaeon CG_4_9_14_3_um_filter_31_7]|nr:MAG: hypothetical protein AUJ10_03650 [Candidatus Pacearchaeota archaeon CG1_02_31_27]PIN91844.1 MAG: 50S ribosomal protein L16 [Candidatus Pacearchaeota archaeon CG10_big_fil_rev_8_21_14_0_10_31_59]PIZ80529.1 MAG: 50S ribosomal protein L16 [Candidatus Pacearchaeota archaeon CG_4_10_14_0_2_um_filter_31_10]PJA70465.1 MAG: 50S ribosomal protein L16 [Candidatus Pacearchaeota archaeon CG_4_9_14_3_um_filter_31_7]